MPVAVLVLLVLLVQHNWCCDSGRKKLVIKNDEFNVIKPPPLIDTLIDNIHS